MKQVSFFGVVVMAVMLLAGCNSDDDAFEPAPAPALYELNVTPSPVSVLNGRTQQLVAMAKYDDGNEEDVSNSVTWEIVGDSTIADVSSSGLLTGKVKGGTELTATKDGITSNTVNVTVCDLADACFDIFDTGSGKLFTNSPSVAYLNSIGGSANNGTINENGSSGPAGTFYLFNWANADGLCTTYNAQSIGGRNNWRLATRDELKLELFDVYGDMFSARGWPTVNYYWSSTPDGSDYYNVNLLIGNVSLGTPPTTGYASCVSNP
jgi:hypothetical protein